MNQNRDGITGSLHVSEVLSWLFPDRERERKHNSSNSSSLLGEYAIVSIKTQTRILNGTEIDFDAI